MLIIKDIDSLRAYREKLDVSLGFVPTMGALHAGHASLVQKALEISDEVICSVFVNPTQFNDAQDLQNYPRTFESDAEMLEALGCHALFAPKVEHIYPKDHEPVRIDIGALGDVMEGAHRPGHFDGVVEVVARLFDLVQPDKAFFGEKDFQQLAVIRKLVHQKEYPIEIVPCPTVRESHGLAMSSRNERLSPDDRQYAAILHDTMMEMREMCQWMNPDEVAAWGRDELGAEERIELEYVEVMDAKELQPLFRWKEAESVRAFVAAHIGGVRLIDNLSLPSV